MVLILNPKILIWFSAVFSQFVKSDSDFLTNSISSNNNNNIVFVGNLLEHKGAIEFVKSA